MICRGKERRLISFLKPQADFWPGVFYGPLFEQLHTANGSHSGKVLVQRENAKEKEDEGDLLKLQESEK